MSSIKFIKSCSPIIISMAVSLSSPVFAEGFSLDSVSGDLSAAKQNAETAQQAVETGKQAADVANAASAVAPAEGGLTDRLVKNLGISTAQAQGGAGAIFKAAQGQLDAGQFAKLSSAVPEMDSLLSAAPKQSSATSSLIGGASSMLGDSASSYGNLAGLASSFSDLNLSPDMVDQFVPVVVDYVKEKGGAMTGDMLQSALFGN